MGCPQDIVYLDEMKVDREENTMDVTNEGYLDDYDEEIFRI